jgi:uncharacterized membrane protein
MDTLIRTLQAQPILFFHLCFALGTLALGAVILSGRKGNLRHRWMGRTWVLLMAGTALTSVFIRGGHLPNLYGFSPIHALTLFVLWQLPRGVRFARQGRIDAHRRTMRGLYVGGCVVAGLFTLTPGRFLGDLLLTGAASLMS